MYHLQKREAGRQEGSVSVFHLAYSPLRTCKDVAVSVTGTKRARHQARRGCRGLERGHFEEEACAAQRPGVWVHRQWAGLHRDLEWAPPNDLRCRGRPVHAAAHDQRADRPQRLGRDGRARGVLRCIAFLNGTAHERRHEQVRGVPVRGRLVVLETELLAVLHAQKHGLRQPVPVDVLRHSDGKPLALLLRDAVLLAQDVVEAFADADGECGVMVDAVHGGVKAQWRELRLVHQDNARGLRSSTPWFVRAAEDGLRRDLRARGPVDRIVDRGLRVFLRRRNDLWEVQLHSRGEQHRVQLCELLVVLASDLLAVLPRRPRLRLRPSPEMLSVLEGRELRQGHPEGLQVVVEVSEVVLAVLPRLPQEVGHEDGVQDHRQVAVGGNLRRRGSALHLGALNAPVGIACQDKLQEWPPGRTQGTLQLVEDVVHDALQAEV
mmetsp:Transcript_67391/g.200350  ORF Transcript_67391/g.200350 Transcript_67391/m.200350 type:complete len:435 (-) Transcript_67391:803-2107(-)